MGLGQAPLGLMLYPIILEQNLIPEEKRQTYPDKDCQNRQNSRFDHVCCSDLVSLWIRSLWCFFRATALLIIEPIQPKLYFSGILLIAVKFGR